MAQAFFPESESLWTTTGKHPQSMTYDELMDEVAVINQQENIHGHLSPTELARLDCLYHYLEVLEEDEEEL